MSLSAHSPLQRSKSSVSHTLETPPISHSQDELHQLISEEIYNQTFQFDSDVVARMLSPKWPRETVNEPPRLSDFDCLIDHPVVQLAIKSLRKLSLSKLSTDEEDAYAPIANFLNRCVGNCSRVYDEVHKKLLENTSYPKISEAANRWFPRLHFMPYDKETGDGIQNASPMRPDVIAVDGDGTELSDLTIDKILAWWGIPQPKDTRIPLRIVIPLEVKKNWSEMVKQAATYARSQFNVSPLRTFALVIAINHETHELRFLIFHHGGLSASKALKLVDNSVDIQKILLSILLYQSAEDVGLPPFTDGQSFYLPAPFSGGLKIESQLYHSLSVRGRNTYVVKIKTSTGEASSQVSKDKAPPPTKESESKGLENMRPTRATKQVAAQRIHNQVGSKRGGARGGKPSGLKSSDLGPSSSQNVQTTIADACKNIIQDILPGEKQPRSLTEAHLGSLHTSYKKALKEPLRLPAHVIVKCSWPNVKQEEMEPEMYKACDGEFGGPEAIISFRAYFREGYRMCNSIFLPAENVESYYWKILAAEAPKVAEHRTLRIMVVSNEGQNFDECLDASDLAQCLLHSMLGWLTAYSCGYMHRDISIGNLLKLRQPFIPRKAFNVWGVVRLLPPEQNEPSNREALDKATTIRLAGDDPKRLELFKIVEQLENAVNQLGPFALRECKAIFTDGDLAAYLPTYFGKSHDKGSISGTTEFMSAKLLNAMDIGEPILQSPLDDLWSFFWTTLWATLFNHQNSNPNPQEKAWRDGLRAGGSERNVVAEAIRLSPTKIKKKDYSLILQQMAPLISNWQKSLFDLTTQMDEELSIAEENAKVEKENAKIQAEYLMLFHKAAYTGVLNFVHVLSKTNLLKS